MKKTRKLGQQRRVVYQPNYEAPKTKRQWRISVFVRPAIYILLFCALVYVLLISPVFQVKNIKVKGNSVVPTGEIQKIVGQGLNETPLSRNILLINATHISDLIKSQSQQIANVEVQRQFPNGLNIVVHEEAPKLLWRSGTQTYVVSDDGHAYSEASADTKGLIVVVDTSNLPIKLGQAVVPASFVGFVRDIQSKLPALGLQPGQLTVGETTSEVLVVTNAGYSIRFDTTRSISDQLSDLSATLTTLKKQNKKPSEYIDLRVPGKVFYK